MKIFLAEAPILSSGYNSKSNSSALDIDFEERLAAVRRLSLFDFSCVCLFKTGSIAYTPFLNVFMVKIIYA